VMQSLIDVVLFNPAGCLLLTVIIVSTVIVIAFNLDQAD
jgi:hypothetical protein